MADVKKTSFARRMADHVADELVNVLSTEEAYEFKALFLKVFDALKRRNAVSGGEEMLRLRCYEKLQGMMRDGFVKKTGKTYRGLKGLERASTASRIERASTARSNRAASK